MSYEYAVLICWVIMGAPVVPSTTRTRVLGPYDEKSYLPAYQAQNVMESDEALVYQRSFELYCCGMSFLSLAVTL